MSDINTLRKQLRDKARRHARSSLFDYLQLIFPEVVPSGGFLDVRHTRLLAHALERVARGEVRRLLIAIPPRFGKSLLGSIALPTWLLGLDPSLKVVCASYGEELARDFAVQSRNAMLSAVYRDLFPGTRLAADGTAIGRLTTTAGGYRFMTSVGGVVTGKGADVIIVDDPLKAKDAVHSQAARDEAFHWITGTLMSRFDRPADGRMIVLSQRLHQEDLIARLRDEGGWELLAVPAEALKPMALDIGEAKPWHLAAGDLLYTQRFDAAALAQLRADLGEANYAAQILQDPIALGGAIFKVKDIEQIPGARLNPDKMEAIFQSWDTAISEEESAAWSVCVTLGVKGKLFGVMDVFRHKLSYPRLLAAVREQYSLHHPRAVFVEKASSGIALVQQLQAEGVNWIHALTPKGSKIERAMHQAPKIESGRLVVPAKAPWLETFLAELAAFPNGRADQVDALCQFLKVFDTGRNHALFRELRYWREQRGE